MRVEYPLLVFLMEDNERTVIHVTDLTGCLRKAFYTKTSEAEEYPHELLVRRLGNAVHEGLERDDPNLQSEMPLSALGIVGKADVVYNNGRILDLKTTRWLTPSRLPYGSHAQQVNIYAALLREMGETVTSAAIQYIDLSGPTKCRSCGVYYARIDGTLQCPKCGKANPEAHLGAVTFEIPLARHEDVVREITERRDALLRALDRGVAPEAEPGFLCDYCPFKTICKQEI